MSATQRPPDASIATLPAALSVIIPARDEGGALSALLDELVAVLGELSFEIVVVDDGSSDDTWTVLQQRAAADSRIQGVRLRRPCGKSVALQAGIDVCVGARIVLIDGDGQDIPAEIPRLLAALDGGLDLVGGRRITRADSVAKRASSRIFNVVVGAVTGVRLRDHNTGLKAARREVLDEVPLSGDLHRFLFVLARHRGFRVGEVDVEHRPRRAGRSKYGALRALGALADLVAVRAQLTFEGRQHRWLSLGGALLAATGALALAFLAFTWLMQRAAPSSDYVPLMSRPLLPYAAAALVLGAQMIAVSYVTAVVAAREKRAPPVREATTTRAPTAQRSRQDAASPEVPPR